MNAQVLSRCRGCYATSNMFKVVLEMDPMPLAGMFCQTKTDAMCAPIFPLTWIRCKSCGLVQVYEEISDTFLFSNYNYASSTVSGLVRHFQQYNEFLQSRYSSLKPICFLEIGCNDGVLLNQLPKNWHLSGVDPSDVASNAHSPYSSYLLYNDSFSVDFVRQNNLENTQDIISGSNCLAHITDLKNIFEGIHLALRMGGHLWIEVHDLDALLINYQWDTIYHEHKVEWSEDSLINCLLPLGFVHLETHRLPLHGGLLRICFQKVAFSQESNRKNLLDDRLIELRKVYEKRYDTEVAKLLKTELKMKRGISAYGASGRANVYLNQMRELHFDYIVDESPLRCGKFIPQVATPIVSLERFQEQPTPICLITAWNYKDDISGKNPQYTGKWLTAFGDN